MEENQEEANEKDDLGGGGGGRNRKKYRVTVTRTAEFHRKTFIIGVVCSGDYKNCPGHNAPANNSQTIKLIQERLT